MSHIAPGQLHRSCLSNSHRQYVTHTPWYCYVERGCIRQAVSMSVPYKLPASSDLILQSLTMLMAVLTFCTTHAEKSCWMQAARLPKDVLRSIPAAQIGKAAAGVVLDKVNPKWALIAVLIGAGGFNSLMAVGNTLTWFNITWFLSRAVYVSCCLPFVTCCLSGPELEASVSAFTAWQTPSKRIAAISA